MRWNSSLPFIWLRLQTAERNEFYRKIFSHRNFFYELSESSKSSTSLLLREKYIFLSAGCYYKCDKNLKTEWRWFSNNEPFPPTNEFSFREMKQFDRPRLLKKRFSRWDPFPPLCTKFGAHERKVRDWVVSRKGSVTGVRKLLLHSSQLPFKEMS